MRIKEGFELVTVAGVWIVVPIGENMLDVNGIIKLTESGAFFWSKLIEDIEINELVSLSLIEYDIDIITAERDVRAFIVELNELRLLKSGFSC